MDIKLFEVMKFLILNNWSLFFYAIKILYFFAVSLSILIWFLKSAQKVFVILSEESLDSKDSESFC